MRSSSFQILQLKIYTSLIRRRKIKEARKDWFQPANLTSLYILALTKSKTNLRHPGIGPRRVVNKKAGQTKSQIITPNLLHLPRTKAKISQVQRAKKSNFSRIRMPRKIENRLSFRRALSQIDLNISRDSARLLEISSELNHDLTQLSQMKVLRVIKKSNRLLKRLIWAALMAAKLSKGNRLILQEIGVKI